MKPKSYVRWIVGASIVKFMEDRMAREHKASVEYPDPLLGEKPKSAPEF